eukprot:9265393-Pyramimonas_sp.AAC.2
MVRHSPITSFKKRPVPPESVRHSPVHPYAGAQHPEQPDGPGESAPAAQLVLWAGKTRGPSRHAPRRDGQRRAAAEDREHGQGVRSQPPAGP